MPSADTRERAASTSTTSSKPERSTRGRACRSLSRKTVEAPRPVVERERVVAPQVLDVHHFESGALAPDDRLGEAGDPAPREDVLAYPELGVAHADVADEVDDAQATGLEVVGVRLDHLAELVSARVLERAN